MALIQVNYLSKALFRTVPVNVILPSDKISFESGGYQMKPGQKFKTLVLLHGMLGNYTDWVTGTRIQRWAEDKNLAVIMPSGDNAFYVNSTIPNNNYEEFIGRELLQVMRNTFPLSDRREDTFIGGLSMGGYGAVRNGMKYAENYSRIIGLSSALFKFESDSRGNGVFGDSKTARESDMNYLVAYENLKRRVAAGEFPMPEFYLACGTKDGLLGQTRSFRDLLSSEGVAVTYDEEDRGHDWDFWDSQIKKVIDWLPLDEKSGGLGSGNVGKIDAEKEK